MKKVEDYVRSIPDFPEPGIIFRDVTSILQDADGLQLAIDEMQHFVEEVDCDVICGTESREACATMIERLGGEVTRIVFLMELAGLKGREKLAKYDVKSVIRYDGK